MVICPDSEAQLQTLRLPATQVDQAFGILLIKGIPMTLAMWRSYAQERIKAASSTTGIISIQCNRAFIHGLFGYEIGPVGVNQCINPAIK
jgi:hypothetical protein